MGLEHGAHTARDEWRGSKVRAALGRSGKSQHRIVWHLHILWDLYHAQWWHVPLLGVLPSHLHVLLRLPLLRLLVFLDGCVLLHHRRKLCYVGERAGATAFGRRWGKPRRIRVWRIGPLPRTTGALDRRRGLRLRLSRRVLLQYSVEVEVGWSEAAVWEDHHGLLEALQYGGVTDDDRLLLLLVPGCHGCHALRGYHLEVLVE